MIHTAKIKKNNLDLFSNTQISKSTPYIRFGTEP